MAVVSTTGTLQFRLGVITTAILVLFGVYYGFSRQKVSISQSLPFGGQFPIASINSKIIYEEIGFPPVFSSKKQRDFDVYLLFTTSDVGVGCQSCGVFGEEFKKAASKISTNDRMSHKVQFASMELKDNRDLFNRIGIEQVPTLLFLPALTKVDRKSYQEHVKMYDLRRGISVDDFLAFVVDNSNVKMSLSWASKLKMLSGFLAALIGLYLLKSLFGMGNFNLGSMFMKPQLWAVVTMVFVLVMTSGLMWVRIRNPPSYGISRDGSKIYLAPGMQTQFGSEVQIISALNAICAISMIALSSKIPNIPNPNHRRAAIFVTSAILLLAFSAEVSVFSRKIGGYPFRLAIP